MRLLLDTHIFLWFINGSDRLSADTNKAIRDPDNEVYLSAVSIWEAIVKYQIGKLPLPEAPETYLSKQRDLHRISSLPLDEMSVIQLAQLPLLRRDPFDRMLICQAMRNDLTLATVDKSIQAYSVNVM